MNQNNKMRSIPDVVGDYYSNTYSGNLHNTFLEFYVYNVYKGGEVKFKKVDQSGYMIEGADFALYLTDPSEDSGAIAAYRATSAMNAETHQVEVDFDINSEESGLKPFAEIQKSVREEFTPLLQDIIRGEVIDDNGTVKITQQYADLYEVEEDG